MNKEEIIKHLHKALNSVDITFPYRYVLIEAIEALSQPSLPSNLDEAAEENSKNYYCSCLENHNETGICEGCENVKLAFKAGAEWREQQIPKLPDNLDEAAIPESEMSEWMEYGPHTNYPWCSVPDAIKITAEHFFALGKQAGAKWMAGQGVSLSHLIAWYIQSVDAHEPVWTKEHLEELVKDYILIPRL